MSVIRVKKDADYFAASNIPFNDETLSWEARGVMGYLLSKPDDWTVRFYDLVKRGPAGEHKIRRILKELEGAGYLERQRICDDGGRFDWVSIIYETPTISRKSPDGDTISRLTTHGSSTHGKPRDITSTKLTSTESNNMEEEADPLPSVFKVYESEIGPLTPMNSEKLQDLVEDHTVQWVIAAIKESSIRNKRSLGYAEAILKRWKVEGYGSEFKPAGKNGKNGARPDEPASFAAIRAVFGEDSIP